MTALLDRAMGVVLSLPSEDQDEIARAMLALAGDDEAAEDIAPEHLDAVKEGLRQVDEGCFATPRRDRGRIGALPSVRLVK